MLLPLCQLFASSLSAHKSYPVGVFSPCGGADNNVFFLTFQKRPYIICNASYASANWSHIAVTASFHDLMLFIANSHHTFAVSSTNSILPDYFIFCMFFYTVYTEWHWKILPPYMCHVIKSWLTARKNCLLVVSTPITGTTGPVQFLHPYRFCSCF